MEMDDDDEFGGLYTDILRPAALPLPARTPSDPIAGGDRIPLRNPSSNFETLAPAQTLAPSLIQEPNDDWLPDNWNEEEEEDDDGLGVLPSSGFPKVVEEPRVTAPVKEFGIGSDLDQKPVIPGLSSAPIPMPNGIAGDVGNPRISNSEDWDSDSEDDLQIVLNDSSHHQHPMMMEDDEDGEEDLVIVTDEDQQQLLHHPSMEEQDWGEGEMAVAPPLPSAEGERREGMDLAKANGPLVGAVAPGVGPRAGYSAHPFQPQHHSMYKYIRPGAAPAGPVVGSVGPPGQIRPPPPFGPVAGRGRGDWRPPGIRGISNTQKSFHSGMPPWANNSSGRAFGGGLDFTLPSHKTVFEVDIESFEEKPWRHPGVDISDYFNFGLDEDNWKDYCKQLEQHRVESTMQSKIRVYESGRSDQDYDPDLPPELAAAAGHHDISADNLQYGKIDNGQVDLSSQGRGIPCIRPPLPTGRAIQVETGSGERLPSIDTRPPRTRDADAIIEIVLQDSMGDSAKCNGAQAEKDIQGEQLEHDNDIEERHDEREYNDGFSQKEMGKRRIPSAPEGDGILPFPPELPLPYHRNSKTRSPINAGGSLSTRHGGRLGQGTSHGRCSSTSGDNSNDAIGSRRAQVNKHDNHQKERLGDSMGGNQTPEISPAIAIGTARELTIEQKDDRLALGESVDAEGEETSDFRISGETLGDDSIIHSKKQKLTSQVEPVIQDNDDDEDFTATHSDSSRAKSGGSKEYRKQRDNGEEVVQDGRLRRASDMRKHQEEEHTIRRKDDYGRQSRHEMDKIRMSSKGREAMYHSYPYREWESNSAHSARGRSVGFERPRESDNLFRQRRDDDIHRRVKDDDIRRDRIEETGPRNRSKIRLVDRNDKEDEIHTKRRVDDADWRGRHREGGLRQRERDDDIMNRRENLDDQVKRKKDDYHSRRDKIDKEDTLPGYRAREDSSHRKRERDDVADRRRREETSRIRDKPDDHHSSKQKDEIWRQREREDRQRLKQPHEDSSTHREREEGLGVAKSRRLIEDKPLGGNGRSKADSKGIGSDKDYLHREKRRQSELSKKGDHEDNNPLHKVRDDVHAREKCYNTEERGSKHERLSIHNDRSTSASDNQHISRERAREGTRKSRDSEGSGQTPQVGKRKHEDHVTQQNERVSSKGTNEQENINAADSKKGPQLVLSSEIHVDDIASDDENQQEARRGRSKLERWTSHKERDFIAPNMQAPSSSIAEDVEDADNDIIAVGELPKIEGNDANDLDTKGGEEGQITEKLGDDRHLDTVAKLKKRSERFKLPMPGDKDAIVSKKPENELQPTQTEGAVDAEVKPERPARKRRWTSS